MARIRTIKPEFWTDSKTGSLSDGATKVFIAMLNFADDFGVIAMDLAELKARIYPYSKEDCLSVIAPRLLDELLPKGLVQWFGYSPDDGPGPLKSYLFIHNFSKHQKVEKPGKPLIPGWNKESTPEKFSAVKVLPLDQFPDSSPTAPRTLPESSGSPPQKEGAEGKGSGSGSGSKPRSRSSVNTYTADAANNKQPRRRHVGEGKTGGNGSGKEYATFIAGLPQQQQEVVEHVKVKASSGDWKPRHCRRHLLNEGLSKVAATRVMKVIVFPEGTA